MSDLSHSQKLTEWKKWRGMNHGQEKHFQPRSMASRCVGIDYTFSSGHIQSSYRHLFSQRAGFDREQRAMDRLCCSGKLASRGDLRQLILDRGKPPCPWGRTHTKDCQSGSVTSLDEFRGVFFTGNLDLQFWNWLCASRAVYENSAFLWCLMALGCHIWGLGKSSPVLHLFVPCKHPLNLSWELDNCNVYCPLSLKAIWVKDFYSIIVVPQKDG